MSKKVFIIEDDKDFLWILRQSFQGAGFLVVFAQSAEDALENIEKEAPDLIIIDIRLPKMDGITMAKVIKEKGVVAPMMFLTNFNDLNHVAKAMEAIGNADYIVKSDMRIEAIVARVKEKLGVID